MLRAHHPAVQEKCLDIGDDLTLEKSVSIGQNHEITLETQKAIEGDEDAKVHTVREKRKEHHKWEKQSSKKKEYSGRKPQSKGKNLECSRCGFKLNHARENCPAKNE